MKPTKISRGQDSGEFFNIMDSCRSGLKSTIPEGPTDW